MATIALVHGAWQDATCWARVTPLLEAAGHSVIAVNLPGRSGDPTPTTELTQALYRDAVLAAIPAAASPVVLVGHSFGGITVANVAEAAPERVARAVFLSAFVPQNGESLQSLAMTDSDSLTGQYFRLTPDYQYSSVADEGKAAIFANDASAADAALIVSSLIPEPAGPQGVPVQVTAARFGRVPKAYIRTARDVVVSPMLQDRMLAAAGITDVLTIDAGHAAYITQPAATAHAILAAASG
jgi:pimeloyl-ACP methyl ester carboxylesterase